MAEVVYAPALFAPLLATVEGLYSEHTRILLGYETRHTSDADFFRQLGAMFERTAVPPEHYHKADGIAPRPDISEYQLTRRQKRDDSTNSSFDRIVMLFAQTR